MGQHAGTLGQHHKNLQESDNPEYGDPDLILKILKFKNAFYKKYISKSEKRFLKEIEALKLCKANATQNVVEIYNDGVCSIRNNSKGKNYDKHLFYTMEYAESDLKKYVERFHATLTIQDKLSLCISLCEGLKDLYTRGFYHRDIKPDNIFIVGAAWKIGDLGLVAERYNEGIDDPAEFIGPRGWLSPEAMNKFLCEEKSFNYTHDLSIDHQSDIFQLGKVFWYIFQHNVPIGSVKESDFFIKNSRIFAVIKTMLRFSKRARYKKIDEVIKLLKLEQQELLRRVA